MLSDQEVNLAAADAVLAGAGAVKRQRAEKVLCESSHVFQKLSGTTPLIHEKIVEICWEGVRAFGGKLFAEALRWKSHIRWRFVPM